MRIRHSQVVERARGACFLGEAPETVLVAELFGREELKCYETVEARVTSLVNNTHTALAEFFQDFVVP